MTDTNLIQRALACLESLCVDDEHRQALFILSGEITRLRNVRMEVESTWHPIETAPRDGSWFVISRVGETDFFEAGCYDQLMWETYEDAGDGLYRKVRTPISEWRGFNNFHRATHWFPISPVPEPAVTEDTP